MYQNEIYHHGINGQKWGVRNGPPYPLTSKQYSSSEISKGKKRKSLKVERKIVTSTRYKNQSTGKKIGQALLNTRLFTNLENNTALTSSQKTMVKNYVNNVKTYAKSSSDDGRKQLKLETKELAAALKLASRNSDAELQSAMKTAIRKELGEQTLKSVLNKRAQQRLVDAFVFGYVAQ